MTRTHTKAFAHSLEVANIWVGEIKRSLKISPAHAWSVLCAVLHTLRDRLTVEQAAHLGNQLPLIVRGAFFDQWRPAHKAKKIRREKEFLDIVRARLPASISLDAKQAVNEVFTVLAHHPAGEIQKIVKTLPPELRALTPAKAPESRQELQESPFAWE
jgi:uncharacterized protein (DUF2267 family)